MPVPHLGDGPAVPALLRELNERVVLDAVWEHQPVHRAELARITGLSKPTVSLSLESLTLAGLVEEIAKDQNRSGRAASWFAPIVDAGYVLGLDIGSQFIRGQLENLAGETLSHVDLALKRTTVKGILSTVDNAIGYLLKNGNVPRERITTTVVGVPGIISPIDGEITEAGSLSTIEDVGFTSQLSDHIGLAVTVDNDVNLMALGERARGLGQGVDNFAIVSVGSGLGAGLVLGGKLHRGAHGGAGEVHLTPFHLLAKDASLFDPASDGLQTSAARIARKRRGTSLNPPYDPVQVFAAARNGDLAALEVVGAEARAITLYLLTIAAVVDVELVILAGGIGTNEDLLLAPIRQLLAEHHPIPPRVETSSLGRGAVLAGAIAVAQERARDLLFTTRLVQNRS